MDQVEGSIPSAPNARADKQREANDEHGIKVLEAACLALNQVGEGSSPSDPTE